MGGDSLSDVNSRKIRILFYVFAVLFILATLFMSINSLNSGKSSVTELETYNLAVRLLDEGEVVEAMKAFSEVQRVSQENSRLEAYALYNMGNITTIYGDGSSETLLMARALYAEALNILPEDHDIRKNIEIINHMLEEQLAEEGKSEAEAEKIIDQGQKAWPQPGEEPGDGEEPGTGGDEEDY